MILLQPLNRIFKGIHNQINLEMSLSSIQVHQLIQDFVLDGREFTQSGSHAHAVARLHSVNQETDNA